MKLNNAPVRVRFAPSPTGTLHIGGARTALFNWLLAKKTNGTFIIRVEDTDEARSTRESEESILNDLKWMNMQWSEGPEIGGPCEPYRQSERKDIYKEFAEKLIADGKAYRCFCTEEELDLKKQQAEAAGTDPRYDGMWSNADPSEVQKKLDNGETYTVRFRVPRNKIVSFEDMVRGVVSWDAEAVLGDFIILRSSGMPVYNFCVAVDDATMKITHVIRAEEHLSNTLRQLLILEAIDYTPPTYAHCSLILGSDRSKLSKRHGATSVKQFAEQGFLPEAMMNYLANLGWNDGTPKEIYTPAELVEAFDMSRIVKSSAVFDMDKLKWINGQHVRRLMSIDVLKPLVIEALKLPLNEASMPILSPTGFEVTATANEDFVNMATKIAQRDMELIADSRRLVHVCLNYDPYLAVHTDPHITEVLDEGLEKIIACLDRDFSSGALPVGSEKGEAGFAFMDIWKTYVKGLGKELGFKGKALFHPLRFAITGRMSGPDIGDQLQLIAAAAGTVNPEYSQLVSLKERMEIIKAFSIPQAKEMAAIAAVKALAAAEAAAVAAAEEASVFSEPTGPETTQE